jgi:hypothetical protein
MTIPTAILLTQMGSAKNAHSHIILIKIICALESAITVPSGIKPAECALHAIMALRFKTACVLWHRTLPILRTTIQVLKYPILDPNCMIIGINNSCTECYFRYYFDSATGLCEKVNDYCKDWSLTTGLCIDCYIGFTFQNGSCLLDFTSNSTNNGTAGNKLLN